ncbi:MAG: hypothetical protein FWF41_03515 [Betaproteobacteria bacterium]|nr:hypothetical protein [Betaproteobacteria bacterium]
MAGKINSKHLLPLSFIFSVGLAQAAESVTASSPYFLQARTRRKKMTISTCFSSEEQNLIAKEGKEQQTLYMYFNEEIDEKPKCK